MHPINLTKDFGIPPIQKEKQAIASGMTLSAAQWILENDADEDLKILRYVTMSLEFVWTRTKVRQGRKSFSKN